MWISKAVAKAGSPLTLPHTGWIALTGLAWFSFNPSPGAINDADQLFGLRFLFALLPSLFFLLAAAIIWSYPITEARHRELRAELEARRLQVNPTAADGAAAGETARV